jgi:hypothetical protein
VGRIDADSVVPPHTVASLKRRIGKVEGIDLSSESQLFDYLGSESPVPDGPLPIIIGECPGLSADRPMALVYLPSTRPGSVAQEHTAFIKILRGNCDCGESFIIINSTVVIRASTQRMAFTIQGSSVFGRMRYYTPMAYLWKS